MGFVFGVLLGFVAGVLFAVLATPDPDDFDDEEDTHEYDHYA